MKQIFTFFITTMLFFTANAQSSKDTTVTGQVTVIKDSRLDILGKHTAEVHRKAANKIKTKTKEVSADPSITYGPKAANGYRLLVVNSNDKTYAMKIRTQLMQHFPDQKVYTSFQAPFIKLKFGNFVDKSVAEKYKKMIINARIVSTNIYFVNEVVEIKAVKIAPKEKDIAND